MRSFFRSLMFTLPVLLMSCMQPQADMAGLKKTVDEYNAASIESMKTNNPDLVMSYYADDATSMPPNQEAVKGKDNIRAWQQQMSEMGFKIKEGTFSTIELGTAGDVGYEIGTYDMTMEMASMGEMKDRGKYVAIFKKQQDGSWKVHSEIWNSDNPVPGMDQSQEKK